MINVDTYNIGDLTRLVIYTDESINKIDPRINEHISKQKYKVVSKETIEQEFFKKTINEPLPFFMITKLFLIPCGENCKYKKPYPNNFLIGHSCSEYKKIYSLHTIDYYAFIKFLSKNGINTFELNGDF